MIVSQKIVAEADIICPQGIPAMDAPFLCTKNVESFQIENMSGISPTSSTFTDIRLPEPMAADPPTCKPALRCRVSVAETVYETRKIPFVPKIRSGSYADIGLRPSMDDEHICVDDLSSHACTGYPSPSAFYGVFDGHGGPEAASYIKENALKLLLQNAVLPHVDDISFVELERSHREAFLFADMALAGECSVSGFCGTTALTALILGRLLFVSNVGDCRAVLCRRGKAVGMSRDHRPCCESEGKRVKEMGGFVDDGYLNGCLAITRALGDWEMKKFPQRKSSAAAVTASPLIAEPEFDHVMLSKDDEFLILGCDGVWDVMSNEHAIRLVRRGLQQHGDPHTCARELVMEALRLHTSDNLTVIVVCFNDDMLLPCSVAASAAADHLSLKRRFTFSEDARNTLRSLLFDTQ